MTRWHLLALTLLAALAFWLASVNDTNDLPEWLRTLPHGITEPDPLQRGVS